MSLVVHCGRSGYDVYVGRPSKWGNPWSHRPGTLARFRASSREDALHKYEEWVRAQPGLVSSLHELGGKVLGCWCRPDACHGDVLIRLVAELCVDCDRRLRDGRFGVGVRCLECYQAATIPDNDDG